MTSRIPPLDWSHIESKLRDEKSGLGAQIGKELDVYTVALIQMFQGGVSHLAGSATLISFQDAQYVLTARHVWDKKFVSARPRPDKFGIMIKESEHKYGMSQDELVLFGPPPPKVWDEWGPDIVLLRIPKPRVAEINALGRKSFFDLSKPEPSFGKETFHTRMLMGAPHEWGRFVAGSVDLDISAMLHPGSGIYSAVHFRDTSCADFDYIHLDVDTSSSNVPTNFQGVSGGGLWRIVFERCDAPGQTQHFLEGVAFHQNPRSGYTTVRCHGPQSIGLALRLTV